jgi:hypothetical protein
MYAAILLESEYILKFITALLPNYSSLQWNQLAVCEEGPGRSVYKAHRCGSAFVHEDIYNHTPYAQRIAEPVHWWFLCRPDNLAIVGLLLLKHCVLEVDLFPDFGRGSFA